MKKKKIKVSLTEDERLFLGKLLVGYAKEMWVEDILGKDSAASEAQAAEELLKKLYAKPLQW